MCGGLRTEDLLVLKVYNSSVKGSIKRKWLHVCALPHIALKPLNKLVPDVFLPVHPLPGPCVCLDVLLPLFLLSHQVSSPSFL